MAYIGENDLYLRKYRIVGKVRKCLKSSTMSQICESFSDLRMFLRSANVSQIGESSTMSQICESFSDLRKFLISANVSQIGESFALLRQWLVRGPWGLWVSFWFPCEVWWSRRIRCYRFYQLWLRAASQVVGVGFQKWLSAVEPHDLLPWHPSIVELFWLYSNHYLHHFIHLGFWGFGVL